MNIQIKKELFQQLYEGNLDETFLSNADTPPIELAAMLQHGPAVCYLVSGYRGAGKSSLIQTLKNIIKKESDNKTVFVHVDFSRYQDKTNLFRWLIRELFLASQGHPEYDSMKRREANNNEKDRASTLLETLHEKTFHDSIQTQVRTNESTSARILTADLANFIVYIFMGWSIFFESNLIFSFMTGQAAAGLCAFSTAIAVFIKKNITYKVSRENKHILHEDATRKTLFDNEIADHHFLTLLKKLHQAGLNLVFVLDEMDKVEESMLDKLSTDIKPYMLSGHAHFIVVSGQKLFYRYRQANTEDDAVLSSIFSKCVHMGLLSRARFHEIFQALLLRPSDDNNASIPQQSSFIDYLIFLSKRVPRIFFQLLYGNIQWHKDGTATLLISHNETQLSLYTRLLDVIDSLEKEEISPESFHPAEKDFLIMQLYLACTTVLLNRNSDLTVEAFLTPETNEQKTGAIPSAYQFGKRMKDIQRRYLTLLLIRLEEASIIRKKEGDDSSTQSVAPAVDFLPAVSDQQQIDFYRLVEFQNLVNSVSVDLSLIQVQNLNTKTFTKLLRTLQRENAFRIPFIDNQNVCAVLDKISELSHNPEGIDLIKKTLTDNKIQISLLINQLMEFYCKGKADHHFNLFGYRPITDSLSKEFDYSLHTPDLLFKHLLFEVVVRRGDPLSDRQFFWDRLRRFQTFSEENFFFFIVFTDLHPAARDAAQARFSNWLTEDPEITPLVDRVMFLPVPFNELHLLQQGFNDFSNKYIKRTWTHIFKEQPAPLQFHERNDDEIDEFFEFKNYNFTIRITPDDSKYWRFGLRFMTERKLPARKQGRHADPSIADINLCAGDAKVVDNGGHHWNHPEQLVLSSHNISHTKSDRNSVTNYDETPLTLTCIPENNGKQVKIKVEGRSIAPLEQIYDLHDYQYCILSAWCDDLGFTLSTNITLERRVS